MTQSRARTRLKPRKRSPYTQMRGELRRKLLFDTTVQLLRERHVEQITYQDIARAAGVPLASCYHFFPGKMELLAALIDHAGPWFAEVTLTALNAPAASWQEMLERFLDTMARNYNEDLAFAQLFSAWKIPRTVYPAHDLAFQEQAERVLAAIDRQFERPKLENAVEIFTFAARVMDAGFQPSLALHGRITDFHLTEGKRATFSYLLNYLPPVLARRELPRTASEPAATAWVPPPQARKRKASAKR